MKISVLIAARSHGALMRETLACVRAQTHSNWEIVVVEYGSVDGTQAIVRDFATFEQRPVQCLNLGESHGSASARNQLLELAGAEWVAFLDPVDRWSPQHLAGIVTRATSGADVIASDVQWLDHATGRVAGELSLPAALGSRPSRALFKRDLLPVASAVAFRRNLAQRVGHFDVRLSGAECRDFWLRCAAAGAHFALTGSATCESPDRSRPKPSVALAHAELTVQFYEKHRDIAAVPAALRRRFLCASLVTLGRLLRTADPARATRCFWRAWSLQPVDVQALGQFALVGWGSSSKSAPLPEKRPHADCA